MNKIINLRIYLFVFLLMALLLIRGDQALAKEITTTIMLDHRTSSLLVNPQTNKIYSISEILGGSDTDGNVHSVIDGETNTIVSSFNTPAIGNASLNPQTNKMYLPYANKIHVVDLTNNTLITSIELEDTILDAKVNPVTNKIYATTFRNNNVYVIDGSTNTVIKTITISDRLFPSKIVGKLIEFNNNSNTIYIAHTYDTQIYIFDGTTHTQVKTYSSQQNNESIISLAFNEATNKLYFATLDNTATNRIDFPKRNQLYFIDTTNKLTDTVSTVSIPDFSSILNLVVDSISNKIYTLPSLSELYIIDGLSHKILQRLVIPFSIFGSQLAINPLTKTMYITANNKDGNNSITVIKTTSKTSTNSNTSSSGSPTSSSSSPTSSSSSSSGGANSSGTSSEPIYKAYDILDELISASDDLGRSVNEARRYTRKIIIAAKKIEYELDAQPKSCSESTGSLLSQLNNEVSALYLIHSEGVKDSGIESLVDDLKQVLETDSNTNTTIDVCEFISSSSSNTSTEPLIDQANAKLEEIINTGRDLRSIRQATSTTKRIISLANKITHALSDQQSNCSESIGSLLLQLNNAASDLSLINHEGVRDSNIGAIMHDLNKILNIDLDSNGTIDVCESE